MIRAVIFDYGNVISVVDTPRFVSTVARHAREPVAASEGFDRTRVLLRDYETGRMSTETFVPEFLRLAGLEMSHAEFTRAWAGFFTPIPFTRKLLRALHGRYMLALLSNTNPLHFEHVIKPTEEFRLFSAITLSYEVGAMKPAAQLYTDMLGKLGLPGEECMYIDDLKENVEAAAAFGMHAVHFPSAKEAEAELRRLLPDIDIPSV